MLCLPWLVLAAWPAASGAQLEILLRGAEPAPPHAGACGRYRFLSQEPTGSRRLIFDACVERIEPGAGGSVVLRLTSGDSLDARVEVAPEFFTGRDASLLDTVRGVVEVAGRDTSRLRPEDWAGLSGFDPAPALAGRRDSLLGAREIQVGQERLRCRGRLIVEEGRQVRALGDVEMTQTSRREVENWTTAAAPILGIVRAVATIHSERRLSRPVPGVPQAGPRTWRYELELLAIGPAARR